MTISVLPPNNPFAPGDAGLRGQWLPGGLSQQKVAAPPAKAVARPLRGPGKEERCASCSKSSLNIAEDGKSYCNGCLKSQQAKKVRPWKKLASGVRTAQDSDDEEVGLCGKCGLALGEVVYYDGDGCTALHGECVAQCMMDHVRNTDKKQQHTTKEKKQAIRNEYKIGWSVEQVPCNITAAKALGCELQRGPGLCGLAFDEATRSVRVVETTDAAASINLEYLALALQVRRTEGREPQFSLDPLDRKMDPERSRQRKRFEPEWLMGTSVGEVMFQADYYLKELSMGEYEQPVTGMRSAFDLSEAEGWSDWNAREWYVVKAASVCLGQDGALRPCVEMGVEAREQSCGHCGLEDALITRQDHPLVKYAEQFTRYFDLIAERKGAVHHLRELAKAVVLAKFLLDADVQLEGSWSELVDWVAVKGAAAECHVEIPQLWKDRNSSTVGVRDGAIVGDKGTTNTHSVYGGVNFGLDRVGLAMYPPRLSTLPVGMASPEVDPASSIQAISGVIFKAQQGVDLDLGKFDLSAPKRLDAKRTPQTKTGKAFWSSLEKESTPHCSLLRNVFNASLSDRRSEGERFVGPDATEAYLGKLQELVAEEEGVRQQRLEHFCSKGFVVGSAGPLFPQSWTCTAKVDDWQAPRQLDALYNDEADPEILATAAPAFDECTEDGLRFRIYRKDGEEVRTIQEQGFQEEVAAVYTSKSHMAGSIGGEEPILKARQYVTEASSLEGGVEGGFHYFLLLQTQRHCIITEWLPSGALAWSESPDDLEERLARAKLVGSTDCSKVKVRVEDLRSYWGVWHAKAREARSPPSASERKHFAQTAYNWIYKEVFGAGPRKWDATKKKPAAQKTGDKKEAEEADEATIVDPGAEMQRRVAPLFKVAEPLRSDEEVVLAALEKDGLDLQRVAEALRVRHDVALTAVRENGLALEFATQEQRADRGFVAAAVQRDGSSIRFASLELRGDRELALVAVQQDAAALEFVSKELRADREVCLAAAARNSGAMKFAAEGVLASREQILAAVEERPSVLAYAPAACLADPEFMRAALEENGLAAEHLPEELRADRAFMLGAVRTNGFALRVASAELRGDAEVVGAALQQDDRAAKYADSDRLLSAGGLPEELRCLIGESMVQQTAVTCAAGHVLEQVVARHGRHACDFCLRSIPQGEGFWGCSDVGCCFDACAECLESQELKLGAAPRRAAATPRAVGRGAFQLVGSWDGWQELLELLPEQAGGAVCRCSVAFQAAPVPRAVSFQILQDRDWGRRFHPSADGASIVGPDRMHGSNWEAWLPAGTTELVVAWDPRDSRSLTWEPRGVFGSLEELPKLAPGEEGFSLAGSWDGWKELASLVPSSTEAFVAHVPVDDATGSVEFQVFAGKDWKRRYHPVRRGVGVVGPTKSSGTNWSAELPNGCRWLRVVWYPRGRQQKVAWSFLGAHGEEVAAGGRS